jgi:hypothetical protein
MPNKYEREIEEILRNMERTEPKPGLGRRFGGRVRQKSGSRTNVRKPGFPSLHFGVSEWCLVIAWGAALFAGGWAFAQGSADLITGVVAVIGAACLAIVVILPFMTRSRYPTQSAGYGNVTPMRRNPLSSVSTRWNLFLLKLRYRRRKGQ